MKRKLSLLMVLMMVLSVVPFAPSFAASGDIKVVNVATDLVVDGTTGLTGSMYDWTTAPRIVFDNAQSVVNQEDTRPLPGRPNTTATLFNIVIEDSATAKFVEEAYDGKFANSKGVEVQMISPYVLEVAVDPRMVPKDGDKLQYQNFEVPMFIKATGYGDVRVRFDERISKFKDYNKKLLIANIHRTKSTAVVDKVGNIGKNNDIVESTTAHGRIRLVENTNTSWKNAVDKKIEIRLNNSDYAFYNIKGLLRNQPVGNAVDFYKDSKGDVDNRTVVVDLAMLSAMNGYSESSRNELVLDLPIRVLRGAQVGTDITVTLSGEVGPSVLTIAKYTDYAIELKAEKVLDVIAGQDIQDKYVAKITLEEMIPGSLLDGRTIEVALTGMKEEEKDGKKETKVVEEIAAFQYDSYVRLEKLKGNGDLNIVLSDLSSAKGTGKYTKVNRDKDGMWLFDVEVNRGSNIDKRDIAHANKWELTLPVVVSADYEGDLNVRVKGAGIPEQFVKIATVKKPVLVEVAKADGGKLADLVIGKQHQAAPDVTIKEVEAGVLQAEDIIRGYKNEYGFVGTGSKKNDLTQWRGAVVGGKFSVVEGDLNIIKSTNRAKDTGNMFSLKMKSSKLSTFKAENVQVTLDRSVPYGPYSVQFDAGNVHARHDMLSDIVDTKVYFNVVTPYPQDKHIKTVFTIGEKKYVQTISGKDEEKEMDVAAQISEGRTMLPMLYVANSIGAVVNYDPTTRVATFQKDVQVVSLNIDQDVMYVNGSPVKLLAKPMNVDGRILLPLRSVAQAFGLSNEDLQWDETAKTVTLFATKK